MYMFRFQSHHVAISRPSYLLFVNRKAAWLWLVVRLYLAYEWISAGTHKITDPNWVGENTGTAISGFLNGTLAKTTGAHPAVSSWYAYFVEHFALNHTVLLSYLVAYGEVLVGIAILLGFLVGVSAFFGALMNINFLLAGATSINPQMLVLEFLLILAWRNAGHLGIDRWLLPKLHSLHLFPPASGRSS